MIIAMMMMMTKMILTALMTVAASEASIVLQPGSGGVPRSARPPFTYIFIKNQTLSVCSGPKLIVQATLATSPPVSLWPRGLGRVGLCSTVRARGWKSTGARCTSST